MQGKDKSYVVSKIKGEEHTYVTLTVVREDAAAPIDISVERRKIESPTVEYEMYDNGMAYIQITEFDLVTTGQFENAYNQAQAEGMKGLIIDLRSNPGGNLSTVCDISRMILPRSIPARAIIRSKFRLSCSRTATARVHPRFLQVQ